MSTLIDSTYFVDDLLIPNLDSANAVGAALLSELNRYIESLQPMYLKYLLGDELSDLFITDLAASIHEARFTALKAKLYNATTRRSPLAGFTFFHLSQVKPELIGLVASEERQINLVKSTRIWNDMSNQSIDIFKWIKENSNTYPEYSIENLWCLGKINEFGI